MKWLRLVAFVYTAGSLIAAMSLGREWLSGVNRAGVPRFAMVAPAWCLPLSALALLHKARRAESVDEAIFYERFADLAIGAGAVWARVGWLGATPAASAAVGVADATWCLAFGPRGALALLGGCRIARRAPPPHRIGLTTWLLAVLAIALFTAWDTVDPVGNLQPVAATALAAITVGGFIAGAIVVAFLPTRRS